MDHRGQRGSEGYGWTTGHQKRMEVERKQKCSTSCQASERSASSKAEGTCQAMRATVGKNPADERMSEKFAKGLHGSPAKEWAESGANKPLRESVEEWKRGSAEKDKGRNDKHQENVLDHVDGERGFVEGGEWGADGDPERKDAGEKSGETRGRR